jgi:protein tyrosine/serine phosphatase
VNTAGRLDWPECGNVRDVGGLPTEDGYRIRRGALIRSDDLCQLTPEGLAALRGYGVRRVLDLRGTAEVEHSPSPLAGDPAYRWTPFIDEVADRDRDPAAEKTTLDTYLGSVERNAGHIAAAVTALAQAPPGGVVVHCAEGKDRTGILVALALRVAGVPPADIAADYAASDERRAFQRELALLPPPEQDAFRDRYGCHPATILAVLEYVDERYGGVEEYLRAHGLSGALVEALQQRLKDAGR